LSASNCIQAWVSAYPFYTQYTVWQFMCCVIVDLARAENRPSVLDHTVSASSFISSDHVAHYMPATDCFRVVAIWVFFALPGQKLAWVCRFVESKSQEALVSMDRGILTIISYQRYMSVVDYDKICNLCRLIYRTILSVNEHCSKEFHYACMTFLNCSFGYTVNQDRYLAFPLHGISISKVTSILFEGWENQLARCVL
jgi:hypothetical protein